MHHHKLTSIFIKISSSHFHKLVLDLQSGQSLVIEHFWSLSLIESEMESHSSDERNTSDKDHKVWHITMALGIERIISELITIWLIMGVGLVHYKISVGVWGENVLVTVIHNKGDGKGRTLTGTWKGRSGGGIDCLKQPRRWWYLSTHRRQGSFCCKERWTFSLHQQHSRDDGGAHHDQKVALELAANRLELDLYTKDP